MTDTDFLASETTEKLVYAAHGLAKINADRGMTGNAAMLTELALRLAKFQEYKISIHDNKARNDAMWEAFNAWWNSIDRKRFGIKDDQREGAWSGYQEGWYRRNPEPYIPHITAHVFEPVRSNPDLCNECSNWKWTHKFKYPL